MQRLTGEEPRRVRQPILQRRCDAELLGGLVVGGDRQRALSRKTAVVDRARDVAALAEVMQDPRELAHQASFEEPLQGGRRQTVHDLAIFRQHRAIDRCLHLRLIEGVEVAVR